MDTSMLDARALALMPVLMIVLKATAVLLWRPAYNLADRQTDPGDAKKVLISRRASGRTDPGGTGAKFDATLEAGAATGFLK